jgi:NAD-dependent SIR2 family protein deacetylase
MTRIDKVECIRCDNLVSTDLGDGLTLTFNQETDAVKACDDCKEVVNRRDHWQ